MTTPPETGPSFDVVTAVEPRNRIRIPDSVIDSSPLRICNIPPDEVFYAGPGTILRDRATNILTIDTNDLVQPLPTSEYQLMANPAAMRVAGPIGGQAVGGYIVDYRRITQFTNRESGLDEGESSPTFDRLRSQHATQFPLGVIVSSGDAVEYIGHPDLVQAALTMAERVDRFVALARSANKLAGYWYKLPIEETIQRPERPRLEAPPRAGYAEAARLVEPTHAKDSDR